MGSDAWWDDVGEAFAIIGPRFSETNGAPLRFDIKWRAGSESPRGFDRTSPPGGLLELERSGGPQVIRTVGQSCGKRAGDADHQLPTDPDPHRDRSAGTAIGGIPDKPRSEAAFVTPTLLWYLEEGPCAVPNGCFTGDTSPTGRILAFDTVTGAETPVSFAPGESPVNPEDYQAFNVQLPAA